MTKFVKLSGAQYAVLVEALKTLFDWDGLDALLLFRLDKQLSAVVGRDAGADRVCLAVVRRAEMEIWLDDLILAMREARPGHPGLETLAAELRLGSSLGPGEKDALERLYRDTGGHLDTQVLIARIGENEARVCRISYPNKTGKRIFGTGFLVAADIVMTNYHVVRDLTQNAADPSDVRLLFDYRLDADGDTLNPGSSHGLARDWLIDSSPFSRVDFVYSDVPADTDPEQLDYALLRIREPLGAMPVGSAKGYDPRAAAVRGWIAIPDGAERLAVNAPLFILQHPDGGPVKLAWHPASVIASNRAGTRVRHKTATLAGSSGSPCFNEHWKLVALHHAGDPNFDHPAEYNQAVPIAAIMSLLEKRGAAELLRERPPATGSH